MPDLDTLFRLSPSSYALGVAAVLVSLILISALSRVLVTLSGVLWTQTIAMIEWLHTVTVSAACALGRGTLVILIRITSIIGSLAAAGVLAAGAPLKIRCLRLESAIREHAKLRQLFWKYGHEECDSFAAFKAKMHGDIEDEAPSAPPASDGYAEAQAVLGFRGDEPLSAMDLKLRYQKMIRVVHSDTGFPNAVFAQQLNHAVAVIKKMRKWK